MIKIERNRLAMTRRLLLILFVTITSIITHGQNIMTVAGNGIAGYNADGIAATASKLNQPYGVAADNSGNIFIADFNNNRIRKVDAFGSITTIAGMGSAGFAGDGLQATLAQINNPKKIALDNSGNIFFSDAGNNRIRKISSSGIITTYAGDGTLGSGGDGGNATAAEFWNPAGVALDNSGNLYIADVYNNKVRKVDTSGIISTIAGTGVAGFSGDGGAATAAQLNFPWGVAVDNTGNIYISDWLNQRIRMINPYGVISTLAGTGTAGYSGDGGLGIFANINQPWGIAVDVFHNVYFADQFNSYVRVINAAGFISTVTGIGTEGYSGDCGAAATATLNYPNDVAIDNLNNLFIADRLNNRIRKVYYNNVLPLSGSSSVCISSTISLSDAVSGGMWSVSNANASILSNGAVTGAMPGLDTVSYTISNMCGSYVASKTVNIGYLPVAGTITGPGSLCVGSYISLTDVSAGGSWSSSNTNAVVSSGITVGLLPGIDTVFYTVSTTCSTAITSTIITVNPSTAPTTDTISTIAGTGIPGFSGDSILAVTSQLSYPEGICKDGAGNIYVADKGNHRIRKIDISGIITTVAGNGMPGYYGDGGAATAAELNNPVGVYVDGANNLYISDCNNNCIRKINSSGIISTIAGNTVLGYSGDGGLATNAELTYPSGVALDYSGNMYIADLGNNVIRKVTPSGVISTFAGNGTPDYYGEGIAATIAHLNGPTSVYVDAASNVFIADFNNNVIRKVTPDGNINTIAGTGYSGYGGDGGAATSATLQFPNSISMDGFGNIYVADLGNQRIREISTMGIITTVAGNGVTGFSGDGGVASSAELNSPTGVFTDATGVIYIADNVNNRVRKITSGIIGITPIIGSSNVCLGSSTTLSNVTAGGSWTASNSHASVLYPGIVTGYSVGTDTISYTITNSCGSQTAIKIISINPYPYAGTVTGVNSVCLGSTITLSASVSGGSWGAVNSNANDSFGIIRGIHSGYDTITYSITNYCGSAIANKILRIDSTPVVSAISGSFTINAGNYTYLHDSTSGGVWTCSNGNATINATTGKLSGQVIGLDTVNYNFTNSCGTAHAAAAVTIDSCVHPSVISGYSHICIGSPVSIIDSTSGGTWRVTNSHATIAPDSGMIHGLIVGMDTVVFSYNNVCGTDSVRVPIIVFPALPTPGGIVCPINICTGVTITLSDTVFGGTWSVSDTLAMVSGNRLIAGYTTGSVIVSYTMSNACGSATTTKTISISLLPNSGAISGLGTVCVGRTDTLTDTASGGIWSTAFGRVTVVGGVITGVTAGVDTVRYSVANSCATGTAEHVVTVNPLPTVAAISGIPVVCPSYTTTLSDSAIGGTWSTSNTNVFVIGGVVTGLVPGTDSIFYTVTNSCGVTVANVVVTINPLPYSGAIYGLSALCNGSTITLSETVAGGVWGITNTNATISSSGVVTAVSAGIDTVHYDVSNSCGTVIARKIITINPLPYAGTILGLSSVCVGSHITLSDAVTGGVWRTYNNSARDSFGYVTGMHQGIDTIQLKVSNGCGADSTIKVVTVNPLPVVSSISGTHVICNLTTTTLTDSIPGGTWTVSNANVTINDLGLITAANAGKDTITYSIDNVCGTAQTKFIMTINPLPTVTPIISDSTICIGVVKVLADSTSGGTWSVSNSRLMLFGNSITGYIVGTDIVTYTVTNPCGVVHATKTISINPLPNPGKISGTDSVCIGGSVTLNESVSGGIWSVRNTNCSISAGVVTGINTGKDTVVYSYTNSCGTKDTTFALKVLTTLTPSVSGRSYVCTEAYDTLSGIPAGGSWSVNNGDATVSSGGVIAGVLAGNSLVFYSVTNYCGTTKDSISIEVRDKKICDSMNFVQPLNENKQFIKIYPNPNQGNFWVELPEELSNSTVSIVNIFGEVVWENKFAQEHEIKVSLMNTPKGTYLIRVVNGKKIINNKLVLW